MAPISSFAPFMATEMTLNGKRAIQLVTQDFENKPKIINLIVQQELAGFTRFPAAYEYVDTPMEAIFDLHSPRQTLLRIVAAPGVSIHLENWPKMSTDALLEIHRIQDPDVLPPQATTILSDYYTPPPELNPPPFHLPPGVQAGSAQYPMDYFVMEQKSSGLLVISHPYSTFSLSLDYPSLSTSLTDAQDAKARFCYQVIPVPGQTWLQELTGNARPPTFTIVKTSNIKAILSGGPPQITAFQSAYKLSQYTIPYQIYEAPDIFSVPPQGADLVPFEQSSWKDVTTKTNFKTNVVPNIIDDQTYAMFRTNVVPNITADQTYAMFRGMLSFIPYVPEVLDIAEFALASATGKDFLGRRVTQEGMALLGLNVILDFLPMSLLAVLKVFKRKVTVILKLRKIVKAANVTVEERVILKEAEKLIRRGGKATKEQLEALSNIFKRMPNEYPPIELLLNANESGFLRADLQEGYQAYKARKLKAKEEPLSPEKWAKSNTTGQYSETLEALLGKDFRKTAAVRAASTSSERMFNILEIMKPMGYTEEQIAADLNFVLAQKTKLAKRLKPLLAELESTDEVVAFMARNQVSTGRLNNIKGVIGEIFALPMLQKILREDHPNSLLFTEVQMKRAGTNEAKQFADNIIANWKGNDIGLRVVSEVKAGKRGGAEATLQMFEWVENRLTDGDQLIIPTGSKYYNAHGVEFTLAKDIRANYGLRPSADEAKAGVGMVSGLAGAERIIIAAKGTSQLGLKSADQVAVMGKRLDLPLTASQIEYLSGQLIRELGMLKKY
ncbi:hypothetical protein NUU61_003801 [Penicillium alfredii]|uniref:Uncharacterized protein n=1 Tax=Penicillium alfredii TaxID=1506179 RepID=A0A9W9KCR9_9EURO|nr:uncharacterized protein NUU61_003801 [Penicillium alfredii]KAJ5101579.1 hypothetical protein NUU61_003801 [Penicillium alfredii]